jgi:hypothetical protein
VSATATLPHPDRLAVRDRPPATSANDLELAVDHLASMLAGPDGDPLEALEEISRAARRLVRPFRHTLRLDEERPVPAVGAWSLENGMLAEHHLVLGEN